MTLSVKRHGQKYELPILYWIKYNWWNLLLILKRTWRRIGRICSYSKATIIVIAFWALFLFLCCEFSKENILCEIDQAKYEIFTSVVLVWIIELTEKIRQYKNLLRFLFFKRYDLENAAEDLIRTLTNNVNTNDMFYSEEDLDLFFEKNDGPWRIDEDIKPMLTASIENIDKTLSDIKESCLKNSQGLYTDEIIGAIDIYTNDTAYFRKMLGKDSIIRNYSLNRFSGYLYGIIESISFPWRRDDVINEKMVKIISEDFYKNQYLDYYDKKLIEREKLLKEVADLYEHKKQKTYIVKPKKR